jgi:pseudaminic acid synthase
MTLNCANQYFKINDGPWKGQTLYELYKKAYTPWEWQKDLKKIADDLGILLLSTPFDCTAVDFLESIDIAGYKIASFELVDIPLLKYVASKNKPIILSTGMATLAEIDLAVQTIRKENNDKIILLKCTSDYPAIPEEMNLKGLTLLKEVFGCPVGLSDHSLSPVVPVVAVTLGASVIEKHFIESRADGGPDCFFSLEPGELSDMVQSIKVAQSSLGKKQLGASENERKNEVFRRSLFSSIDIKKDEVFTDKNIRSVRPGYGLKPKYYDEIIGKKATCDIAFGTPISWKHIKIEE